MVIASLHLDSVVGRLAAPAQPTVPQLPEDREAILLCDIEGMTQAEYATRLGISLPGAKSRVQRARQRLKARLSEACRVRYDERGNVCCFTPRPPIAEIDD